MDASLLEPNLQRLEHLISGENTARGYKADLEKLRHSLSTFKAVLYGFEEQDRLQPLSRIPKHLLGRLNEAVYEIDDLVDEIFTTAVLRPMQPGNKVSKEVRLFFSRFHYAFTKSREIHNILDKLGAIAQQLPDFGSVQVQAPPLKVEYDPRQSYEKERIFGRHFDKCLLTELLLDPTTVKPTVLSIVGIGGLGKTTLAQLVYNDHMIYREFQLKMWVSVSHDFNVTLVLCKILAAATNDTNYSGFSMDQLQRNLRQALEGKKYLLVLDDIWYEDREKWLVMEKLLMYGGSGSRIIVTTRFTEVAKIVGSYHLHELRGLSEEDSFNLFTEMTLVPGQYLMNRNIAKIVKKIVERCYGVPLALKVISSLIRSQDEDIWHALENTDFDNIDNAEGDGIMFALKLSYNYLPPYLKSCFNFCATYPKGYQIIKENLIYQWMAQGFIMSSDEKSLEELGEEYITILWRRCFFQEVIQDSISGVVVSCTIHDSVHDLAKREAWSGIEASSVDISSSNDKTRHVYINGKSMRINHVKSHLTNMVRLRTCLGCRPHLICTYGWLTKMRFLRVLDLSQDYYGPKRNLKQLPSMIGELVHLRYLDLSCNNELSTLSDSITKLFNLETLKLCWCSSLKELPRELSRLVNLRHLDLWGCNGLRCMPPRMKRMADLCKLTMFVVGGSNNASCFGSIGVGKLEDLKHLCKLRGEIEIKIKEGYDAAKGEEGGYLMNKPDLNHIEISWNCEPHEDDAEELLQSLQPHHNVKMLRLCNYPGVKFPSWGDGDSLIKLSTSVPNLVELCLSGFTSMKHLPLLNQLGHLKVLQLWGLRKVEYVESRDSSRGDGTPTVSEGTRTRQRAFFRSLEKLVLCDMPMLKGWCEASSYSESGEDEHQEQEEESLTVGFPRLADVFLRDCPELTTLPELPELRELRLMGSNKALGYFHSLSGEAFQHLYSMSIREDDKLERLSTLKAFRSGHLSSLRSLELRGCIKFKSVSEREVWKHLTGLETLELGDLKELELENNEGDDNADMPWIFLTSLQSLKLDTLPKLRKLPMGMRHLTALSSLSITHCCRLEEVPTWISSLTSVRDLSIKGCPRVKSVPEAICRHIPVHLSLY